MKALVVGAGAGWSTKDVENGVVDGLRAAGVSVGRYAYEHRLATSDAYLRWVHRRAKRAQPDAPAPTAADVRLHALVDVLPRALAHQVDWVILISGMFVPSSFLQVLQRAGLPVALVLTESPYEISGEVQWAAYADLVWTNERTAVSCFRSVCPSVSYLPHAWRPQATAGAVVNGPAHDVVFVGTGFPERVELLEAIDWTGIDLGLYGGWKLSKRSPLRACVRDGIVDNAITTALYRRAKIGLNLHRQSEGWTGRRRIAYAESLNPRAYELAACGVFHVSDDRAEVGERFGALVPTFQSAQDCEALIRQWLADDAGRNAIAAQLPAAVGAHSWHVRGRQMVRDLEAALPAARDRVLREAQARALVAA